MASAAAVMKDALDQDVLRDLHRVAVDEAKRLCIEMLDKTKTKADRLIHLKRDIMNCRTSVEAQKIMWNVILAGNGLATLGSRWQKDHGAKK